MIRKMEEARKRRRLSHSANVDADTDLNTPSAIPESHAIEDNVNTDTSKPQHRRTLFVRSLPPSTTTEALTEYFSQSYPIKHATVVLDPKTKQSKGYGFVTLADHEDAQQALEQFNGTQFEGRKLKIEIAEPRHRDAEKEGEKSTSRVKEEKEKRRLEAQPPKLIIRNLPFSITEPDQLAVLFRSFGKVKHAAVPKKGKVQAGFGFVVMRGKKNAEKAIEGINGKEVDGRMLAVDWAVEKNVWESLQNPTEAPTNEVKPDGDQAPAEDEADDNVVVEDENDEASQDGESEDDMNQDDDEISMSDVSEPEEDGKPKGEEDERNASTIFIRNLPFTATDETLYEHFLQFGSLRYARVVVDYETERPRGTAFVCFWNSEDAISCIRGAPKRSDMPFEDAKNRFSKAVKHSILEDENKDPSGRYSMDGRVLQISAAVSREKAVKLEAEGHERRDAREKDKRRLYLLPEGTIPNDSPLYSKLSPSEVKLREASAKQRQTLIKSNPMLHISLTRLSVRNVPRNIDSKALKALAREAVVGFAKDVKSGLRQPLSKEELSRDTDEVKEADVLRKKKGKGIVKQSKIVFEGREGGKVSEDSGGGRSRGYGFVEYTSHRCALMGLRWLNGHAVKGQPSADSKDGAEEKHKRLVVEFAIENAQVVKRRQEYEAKSRTQKQEDKQEKQTPDSKRHRTESTRSNGKGGMKRKRTDNGPKDRNPKKPAQETTEDKGASAEKNNELAKRNRIIGKKRMMRRARK